MSEKVVIIVQARLGSTRLPGKILKPLNGYPVLEHVLRRCAAILGKQSVVCAGVDKPEEAPVRELAEKLGFKFYAGSERDVLARYYLAAKRYNADWVVRVTSDCPLLDPGVCRGLIQEALERRMDFGITTGWPHGLDCEILTFALLERAYKFATSEDDREHVTLWVKRQDGIKQFQYRPAVPIPEIEKYRWVLDYPEDYEMLQHLAKGLKIEPRSEITYRQVIDYLKLSPGLLELNRSRIAEWGEAYKKLISKES